MSHLYEVLARRVNRRRADGDPAPIFGHQPARACVKVVREIVGMLGEGVLTTHRRG